MCRRNISMNNCNYLEIIDKIYGKEDSELKRILLVHSCAVTKKALHIVDSHPELMLDRVFVEEAAMLHDIGIINTNAPGICCRGTEPYIRHGIIGAEMLRKENLNRHARVCERHTGAGLTKKEITTQQLPLPHQDFLPETLEEQVICYADKFFSKTNLEREKTVEQAEHSLAKFGEEGVERFRQWHQLFG